VAMSSSPVRAILPTPFRASVRAENSGSNPMTRPDGSVLDARRPGVGVLATRTVCWSSACVPYPLAGGLNGAATILAVEIVDAIRGTPTLRVLVSDGPGVRLDHVTRTVARLGHEVIARESSLPEVARITAAERPDVAIVIVDEGSEKALQLIDRIVHEGRLSRDRGVRCAGPGIHPRGCQARHLRVHRQR
jgi:hypothetical protein